MKNQVPVTRMVRKCDEISQLMRSLAHPQRLMILCHLIEGEKSAGELVNLCAGSQSGISQFLNRMRLEGIVSAEKRGLYVYYAISDQRARKLVKSLCKLFC